MLMRSTLSCRRTWLRCRSVQAAAASQRAFHSLGLEDELVQRVAALGITEPTPAQRGAIPKILNHDDVVVGAETGSGKTLAYLLPLVQKLNGHPLRSDFGSIHKPVVVIMTTSQLLVRQIAEVLRQLDPEIAKRAVCLTSNNKYLMTNHAAPIVIATPRALLAGSKPKDFAFTETIVVDEADLLLAGDCEKITKQIVATIRNQPLLDARINRLQPIKRRGQPEQPEEAVQEIVELTDSADSPDFTQTIFCSATIPDYGLKSVRRYIDYKFPMAQFIETEDFHRTSSRLEIQDYDLQEFMQAQKSEDAELSRKQLLLSILKSDTSGTKKLIFSNATKNAVALVDFLQQNDIKCLELHKHVHRNERQLIADALHDDESTVFVATDIAARGLDTLKVGHVIQYDFALDVVSFLHRSGRTARAGTTGKLSNIISSEDALLLGKLREAGEGGKLNGAFSRKRSLRKKFKKALKEEAAGTDDNSWSKDFDDDEDDEDEGDETDEQGNKSG